MKFKGVTEMNKNTRLIYCLLGSILLVLLACPLVHNLVYSTMRIGSILSGITDFIALIGVVLTVIFSVMLIIFNCINKGNN